MRGEGGKNQRLQRPAARGATKGQPRLALLFRQAVVYSPF